MLRKFAAIIYICLLLLFPLANYAVGAELDYAGNKPPAWACDPGTVAYNAQRMGLPMPVGLWPLWEGVGNTIYDYSGNRNDGVNYGADWVIVQGGLALDFDGINDYIKIAGLELTTELSVFIRIKLDDLGIWNDAFSLGNSDNSSEWYLETNGSTTKLFVGGLVDFIDGDTALGTSQFANVIVTFDGSVGRMYVNNNLEADTGSVPSFTAVQLYLGTRGSALAVRALNCKISSLNVFSTALTPAQIATLSADPYGLVRPIPMAAWLGSVVPTGATQPILQQRDPHSIIFGGQILSKYSYPDDYFKTFQKPILKTGTDE